MLKESTPAERLNGALGHFAKLEPIVYFSSIAIAMVFYDFRYGTIPEFGLKFLLFALIVQAISGILTRILFWPLAAWIGKVSFKQTIAALGRPNQNPRPIERFLDGWWNNERVIDVFMVVSRIAVFVFCYRFIGPHIGIF
jgi:hypothetical protein